MLLHLARLQPLGTEVEFSAHLAQKTWGEERAGKTMINKNELMRLITGGVEITWTKDKKSSLEP
jgi:hypothetical protein